jgi:predicted SAM-dependent methyltransferase
VLLRYLLPPLRAARSRLRKLGEDRELRRSFKRAVLGMGNDLKVIVGASGTVAPGWLTTEFPMINIADRPSLDRYFRSRSVQAFLAEHVWEHLAPQQASIAVANCYRLLKPGGYLRIAVPDGLHPDKSYIEYVRPGGTGAGSDDHKVLYTYKTLSALLEEAGFEARLLEWFDEEGRFHVQDWDSADGFICRSTRFDERNRVNPTAYTSIIADAIKPAG